MQRKHEWISMDMLEECNQGRWQSTSTMCKRNPPGSINMWHQLRKCRKQISVEKQDQGGTG